MTHRFLLCMLLLSLVAMANATQPATDDTGESWAFSSDEGGGGSSYLGVDITDVTAERLSALKLKEEHGAEITMVDADAPAGKAGLLEHDVILSLNGNAIESAAQLRRMIKETPPDRVVTLGISRDGQPMTIKVQLAERHKSTWAPGKNEFHFEMPKMSSLPDIDLPISVVIAHSSLRSGLMVENITPQLGEFFGVKGGNGVLVRSVEKGSRGEKAGFHAGDIVVKVNGQTVHDASDFTHALRSSSGGSASVIVMREKKEQTLTLPVPEKKDSGQLIEDTLEIPAISEETELAISHAGDEIARVAPSIMEKIQDEMKCAGEATQRVQQRWQAQQEKLQKRLQEQQQKMQEQQKKMEHELAGDWAEI